MKKLSSIAVFVVLTLCLIYTVKNRWKGDSGEAWKGIIRSDGCGYYSYLPCVFIYHKFDYDRVLSEERKYNAGAYPVTTIDGQNKVVDKCFSGVAVLLIPFFLIAYFLSHLLGYGTGGYELLFQVSVSVGALFYLGLGLIFIRKLLKEFAISEWMISVTLILVVFATNLFYYVTMEPSLGHVYSFGMTALFLYYTKRSIDDFRLKNLLWMTIAIGVLVIIRPTNLFSLLFIPFFAGSFKDTFAFIRKLFTSKVTLILVAVGLAIVFIQVLMWYGQTGKFYADNYRGEGFDFSKPHFLDILFSYRNGWFLYSPIMFIAVLGGLIALFRKSVFQFFIFLLFFCISTFILSSWWCWWYGGAFGLRSYIDYYPAFALLLGLFLNSLSSWKVKAPVMFIGLVCIAYNMFQTYQYLNFILPNDFVTKEQYWKIFLKHTNLYSGIFDYPDTTLYKYTDSLKFKNDYEGVSDAGTKNITSVVAHSCSHSVKLDIQNQNTPELKLKGSKFTGLKNPIVFVKLWAFMGDFDNDAKLIVQIRDKSWNVTYWVFRSLQGFAFEKNMWTEAYYVFSLPDMKPDDTFITGVNLTYGTAYIDDMEVSFGTPK